MSTRVNFRKSMPNADILSKKMLKLLDGSLWVSGLHLFILVTPVPPRSAQSVPSGTLLGINNPNSTSYPNYTPYAFAWIATGSSATLSFSFRDDLHHWLLDDVSVYHGMTQLITNGGFETGDLTGWTYSSSCLLYGGQADNSRHDAHTENWYYYEGCLYPSSDALSQTFPMIAGDTYIISFWLTNDHFCLLTQTASVTIA